MALIKLNFLSRELTMQVDVSVIIPESWHQPLAVGESAEKFPVLWLLHGGGGDHTDWQRFTSIERYANAAGLAVVMPGVDHSGYMDTVHGNYKYFTFLTSELPSYLCHVLPLSSRQEDNFVAGLSMGGYGSVKWMLHYPERFAACGCFSGAIDICYLLPENEERSARGPDFIPAFGSASHIRSTENDNMFMFEKRLKEGAKLPKLYVACGVEDIAHPQVKQAVARMREMGVEFEYIEDHGEHEWGYWDRHIDEFIKWIPLAKKEAK